MFLCPTGTWYPQIARSFLVIDEFGEIEVNEEASNNFNQSNEDVNLKDSSGKNIFCVVSTE